MALLLGGCQSPLQQLQAQAQANEHQLLRLPGQPFPLQAAVPTRAPGAVLRLYLEGDGHAWITADRPSLDPTPRYLLVAQLAMQDPTPSAYLARPCQFISATQCNRYWWTTDRYAPPVVDSLNQALDQLKAHLGNQRFELIGYSGGATLALLLAEQRNDIENIQTLAGNLSPQRWSARLGLSPLADASEPDLYDPRLANIRQRHLAGAQDTVMPPELSRQMAAILGAKACVEFHQIARVSHQQGWLEAWPHWRDRSIECHAKTPENAALAAP